MSSPDRDRYFDMVASFREITDRLCPTSDRCCEKVHWPAGIPDCCQTILTNESCLVFSRRELEILLETDSRRLGQLNDGYWEIVPGHATEHTPLSQCGVKFVKHGQFYFAMVTTEENAAASMHRGLLANTLECASHPTVPVLDSRDRVAWVLARPSCMAEHHLDHLRANADALVHLWGLAIELTGVKPYYRRNVPTDGMEIL